MDAEDQFILGLSYATGKDVPQRLPAATAWYRKAAQQEHADALRALEFLAIQ